MSVIQIAGMLCPKKSPRDFEFSELDSHILIDDRAETATAFDYWGEELWKVPAIAKGINGNNSLAIKGGDTPYGLYVLGERFDDRAPSDPNSCPAFSQIRRSFGPITYDMMELENQENSRGRAGICLHGGGTRCGWPGAWADYQPLYKTLGCPRMHNADIVEKVDPLYKKGRVFVSVYQEDF